MFSCSKQWLHMFKPHTWNMNAFLHACGLLVIWLVLTWLQTTKLICLQFLDNIFILPTSVGCMSIANLHMNNWCVGVMDNTFCKSKENHGKISTLIWLLIWNGHLYWSCAWSRCGSKNGHQKDMFRTNK